MTGLVLISKEPSCRGLHECLRGHEQSGIHKNCICGSGAAGALALLYSMGVSIADAEKAISEAALCGDIGEAEAVFGSYIGAAGGDSLGYCVPVMDTASLAQYSYTNIEALISSAIEAGLSKSVSPSLVAASAVFGLCPGFGYLGRTYSAGRENPEFCINCLKRIGCERTVLEG